jgi:hypothetical protein
MNISFGKLENIKFVRQTRETLEKRSSGRTWDGSKEAAGTSKKPKNQRT